MVITSSGELLTESRLLMPNQSMVELGIRGFINSTDRHYDLTLVYSDEDFWTQDQLILIKSFPREAHLILGTFLSIICALGIMANALVLLIFLRFE